MRRPLAAMLLLFSASLAYGHAPTAKLSPSEMEQRAKTHFKLGLVHLDLKEYDAAISEFQTGYEYKAQPLFLYNIAQVAALAGHRQMAVDYYHKYLEANPRAPERPEVNQRLEDLQRSLAANPETPPPVANVAPPAEVAPAAPALQPTPEPSTVALTAQPPERKSHKKLAIALGVVGGVVVIGAALAIGLTVGTHSPSGTNWGTLTVSGR